RTAVAAQTVGGWVPRSAGAAVMSCNLWIGSRWERALAVRPLPAGASRWVTYNPVPGIPPDTRAPEVPAVTPNPRPPKRTLMLFVPKLSRTPGASFTDRRNRMPNPIPPAPAGLRCNEPALHQRQFIGI